MKINKEKVLCLDLVCDFPDGEVRRVKLSLTDSCCVLSALIGRHLSRCQRKDFEAWFWLLLLQIKV